MRSKDIRQHWNRIGQLPCAVTRRCEVTLHHAHGGSLREEYPSLSRGKGQKPSDWLVIPLHAELHTGQHGIDTGIGVQTWESIWGRQVDMLQWVSDQVGYDVIRRALDETE